MSALSSIPKGRKFRSVVVLGAAFAIFSPLARSNDGLAAPGAQPEAPAPAPAPSEGDTVETLTALQKEGLVLLEVFTLPREDARAATRRFPKQADLYAWLGAELEKENATVKLERMMVLRVRAGQKSRLQEIDEYPFPTEFTSPNIPQAIGVGQPAPSTTNITVTAPTPQPVPPASSPPRPAPGAEGESGPTGTPAATPPGTSVSTPPASVPPWPYAPACPHSFVTKESGWTADIEMLFDENEETLDLTIAPRFVRLCGLENQSPNGEIVQPVFQTSTIQTSILTKFGQPTFAGTFSAPVNTGGQGVNQETTTRLLFITVTAPR